MIAQTDKTFGLRPRMVLACGDMARAALSSRQFAGRVGKFTWPPPAPRRGG